MRDAGHAARLQHRHAVHDRDDAAARIGQPDDAVPALPVPAQDRAPRAPQASAITKKRRRHTIMPIDDRGIRRGRLRVRPRHLRRPTPDPRHRR